jgi:hypothetical protein
VFLIEACLKVTPPSCRTPVGQSAGLPQPLLPESKLNPGFDVVLGLTTRHQRFTHVRLPETHLTEYPSAFSHNAHHQGSLPSQLGVVWNLLLQADSGGPPHLR